MYSLTTAQEILHFRLIKRHRESKVTFYSINIRKKTAYPSPQKWKRGIAGAQKL